jgi:hypothetical protein
MQKMVQAWLIRSKGKKQKAHVWTGTDTLCRMWSTGGMKPTRFQVRAERGDKEICFMCMKAMEACDQ